MYCIPYIALILYFTSRYDMGLSWPKACWLKIIYQSPFCCSRRKLSLADQDLLNMVGSVSPWLVQPLPCPWNYHTWTVLSETKREILARCNFQCRPARFEMSEIPRMREGGGKNMCPEAESEGVGFLHGNSQVVKGNDLVF